MQEVASGAAGGASRLTYAAPARITARNTAGDNLLGRPLLRHAALSAMANQVVWASYPTAVVVVVLFGLFAGIYTYFRHKRVGKDTTEFFLTSTSVSGAPAHEPGALHSVVL